MTFMRQDRSEKKKKDLWFLVIGIGVDVGVLDDISGHQYSTVTEWILCCVGFCVGIINVGVRSDVGLGIGDSSSGGMENIFR